MSRIDYSIFRTTNEKNGTPYDLETIKSYGVPTLTVVLVIRSKSFSHHSKGKNPKIVNLVSSHKTQMLIINAT